MSKREELASAARGFAGPVGARCDELFEAIAVGYALEAGAEFFRAAASERIDPGIQRQFESWGAGSPTADDAWRPIFGRPGASGESRAPTAAAKAIGLGLGLGERGVPGEWRQCSATPVAWHWGPWFFPPSEEIRFVSDGREAEVEFAWGSERRRARFRRASEGWSADWPDRDPTVRLRAHDVVLPLAGARRDPTLAYLHDDLLAEAHWGEASDRFRAARDVLDGFAPEYLEWIDRVTRTVIPLRGDGASINSGSGRDEPGSSHMSFDCSPASLAEMLVHEGTHQYFYLLGRLGPVDDGSDPTLYYSPVKRRGRPIHFILLAYHAFANVLLFSRRCLERGFEDREGQLRRNLAGLPPQLEQLEAGLRTTSALTPLGRALWEPLREALR